jgi:RND superfamily putative drug exporter
MTARLGIVGRLGRWSADHRRAVLVAWAVVAIALGFLAPRVETALSGAGWEDSGSESVAARAQIARGFDGASSSALMVAVHSDTLTTTDPAFRAALRRTERILAADGRVSSVQPPRPGATISPDGHTAIVMAGAAGTPTGMVRAADDLKGELRDAAPAGMSIDLTGASGMWSDFNAANRDAMMTSELLSWPVTLAILVVAFGALVAAGLPLLLTIVGLVASAGALVLAAQAFDVSIWAMNFALMFALALGIDYALYILVRFRSSLFGAGRDPLTAVA